MSGRPLRGTVGFAATRESFYGARCQTGGRLRDDRPRRIEEIE